MQKMLLQCSTPDKNESRLDLLSWMYKQDYKISNGPSDCTKRWLHTQNALLTWNGDFGHIDNSFLQGLLDKPVLLVKALLKRADVKEICVDLEHFAGLIVKHLHLKNVSCSVELCTTTLANSKTIRLHCHMMLEHNFGCKISVYGPDVFLFRGSLPNKSMSSLMASIGTKSSSNASAGHYYLLMPKIGKLWSSGSVVPFRDFRVNPDHIMAFVQSGKMDPVDAMHQLLQTCKDPERHIKTLEYCKMKLRQQAAEQRVEERCKMLARDRHPRRIIPLVDEVFLPHMLELKDRHRFLVLDGPS